ncbi:MAG: CBS domain-containing protein [Candidatus Sericytochromatia bacterium]|nr:CBS domain-containing protein [Candidatus Sericytochromatia bacterium]
MSRPGPGAPAPDTVIVTHIHSDLDALAATVAARVLFPGAVPVLQPTLDPQVRELAALHRDVLQLRTPEEVDLKGVRRVVVVDTRSRSRLGTLWAPLDRPEVEWLVFDHHPPAPDELPGSAGRREVRGSCTSLLVEALAALPEVTLAPVEATLMALGIYADTDAMRVPGTTAGDVRAVAWLLERGADLAFVNRWVDAELAKGQLALLEQLLAGAQPQLVQGARVVVVGTRTDAYVAGIAAVADRLQLVLDADVVVLAVEMAGKRTHIVARSRLDGADMRGLLAPWAGQGHLSAASAHADGLAWEAVVSHAERHVAGHLPPEPRAEDLMSSPVRTIEASAPVAEAVTLLGDTGHSGLVVMRRGKAVGVVSRRDLERAARHGLVGTEVRHVMTNGIVTTSPDTPMHALLTTMVRRDIGRLPVLRDEALVGIVTRSDLLRAQYDRAPDRRAAVSRRTATLGERLRAFWPDDWWTVFDTVSDVASGRPVYLVGGAVRDLLLDRPNLDADLVVEGDGVAFAEALREALPGATLKVHRAFGTAHLHTADGKRLDVASARTEHYDRPGALPRVALSSLKQDLARRDFSVNCLAVRIDRDGRGELIDFFEGLPDLAQRSLRVLHNLSFIEDPTRVLRAVRFEQTLGFRLEPGSEAFARFAFESGACDRLAGERTRAELSRLLSLSRPTQVLERLADLGALRLLAPELTPGPDTRRAVAGVRNAQRRLGLQGGVEAWIPVLGVVLWPLGVEAGAAVLGRLNMSGRQCDGLVAAWRWLTAVAAEPPRPSDACKALSGLPEALLPLVYALAPTRPARRAVLAYHLRWRHLRLTVGGDDLKRLGVPPGPHYAAILTHVLEARLAGTIGPEGELALLHDLATRYRAGDPA